jgi:hypothetical protein
MNEKPQSQEKIIKKYFEMPDGRKEWSVTGELGSISFWVDEMTSEVAKRCGEKFFGGVETHYNKKSKPDYLDIDAHHASCLHNGGECWHDGTSLWASEYWIPHILPLGQDAIWQRLTQAYRDNFKPDESEAA